MPRPPGPIKARRLTSILPLSQQLTLKLQEVHLGPWTEEEKLMVMNVPPVVPVGHFQSPDSPRQGDSLFKGPPGLSIAFDEATFAKPLENEFERLKAIMGHCVGDQKDRSTKSLPCLDPLLKLQAPML